MLETIEEIQLQDIVRGVSCLRHTFHNVRGHSFAYKVSGESLYRFENYDDLLMPLRAGELLFIPKGSVYEVTRSCTGTSEYVLLSFDADIPDAHPQLWSMEGYPDTDALCSELVRLWLFDRQAAKFKARAALYNILAYLTALERAKYTHKRNFSIIAPAVEHLQCHIFDAELRAGELHHFCGVSDTYFRQIFRANYGVTPREYVRNKRLAQARAILSSGDFRSVAEVARSVGYTDPLYFSRIFSRKFGYSPSYCVHCSGRRM